MHKLLENRDYLYKLLGLEYPYIEYRITVDGICKGAWFYVFYNKTFARYGGESNIIMYKPSCDKPFEEWDWQLVATSESQESVDVVINNMVNQMIDYFNDGYTRLVYTKGIYSWSEAESWKS